MAGWPSDGQASDGQPAGAVPAVAIRRPSGDVVLVDADMVGRVGG